MRLKKAEAMPVAGDAVIKTSSIFSPSASPLVGWIMEAIVLERLEMRTSRQARGGTGWLPDGCDGVAGSLPEMAQRCMGRRPACPITVLATSWRHPYR